VWFIPGVTLEEALMFDRVRPEDDPHVGSVLRSSNLSWDQKISSGVVRVGTITRPPHGHVLHKFEPILKIIEVFEVQ
jgi:hypothetical protein